MWLGMWLGDAAMHVKPAAACAAHVPLDILGFTPDVNAQSMMLSSAEQS